MSILLGERNGIGFCLFENILYYVKKKKKCRSFKHELLEMESGELIIVDDISSPRFVRIPKSLSINLIKRIFHFLSTYARRIGMYRSHNRMG